MEDKKQFVKKIKRKLDFGEMVTKNEFEQALTYCDDIRMYGEQRDKENYEYLKNELLFTSKFSGLSL
ncbi:hypothetical protein [Macrococcus animalis]|uniref:hypothetical protein n=1 Tax=Macrococcus animalis TaxID=3395467 RepID=UPI0039BE4DEF